MDALTIVIIVVAVIVAIIALILGLAAVKPDHFSIERSISIKASAERIFPLINDLHAHSVWSPWEKKDPNIKKTYSGPSHGKGAAMAWVGNRNVGQGRMEITDASPPSRIVLKLDFIKPMEGHNTVEYRLNGQAGTTQVTWAMQGPVPFLGKIMHVICNMDKMIGKEFDKGLADLKALAER